MKNIPTLINAALCGLLVFILLVLGLPGQAAQAASAPSPTPSATAVKTEPACDTGRNIQVSGSALVNVAPDRALIKLGVESNGLTARSVQATNTSTMTKIIEVLKGMDIQPKDIATDYYVINPVYDEHNALFIKGYRIHNYLAVTIRDVHKLSDVIITATEAGANEVLSVDLYTSELRKYRDQARELAVKAAREKALALAGGAGAQTGCVMHITESISSYYNGWWYGSNPSLYMQNVVQNAVPAGGDGSVDENGPVSLGQISVRATVDVTYALK